MSATDALSLYFSTLSTTPLAFSCIFLRLTTYKIRKKRPNSHKKESQRTFFVSFLPEYFAGSEKNTTFASQKKNAALKTK